MNDREMIKTTIQLTVALLCLWPRIATAGVDPPGPVELRAFGSSILVPRAMIIDVSESSKGGILIRIFPRYERLSDAELLSISIIRPFSEDLRMSESSNLLAEYELNGFDVRLYLRAQDHGDTELLFARVFRCNEIGQLIATNRQAIDDYLTRARASDC